MTHQDIINHFRGYSVTRIAEIFNCSRRLVYDWRHMERVPEIVSLRADYMTGGDLPHDPSLYGAEYKRGEYRSSDDAHTESMQSS